ncbi:MAG: hypothetical protein ACLQAT_31410 [Candidatus Binataceae bacterium]
MLFVLLVIVGLSSPGHVSESSNSAAPAASASESVSEAPAAQPSQSAEAAGSADLDVISWNCQFSGHSVEIQGEVKNISGAPITDLEGVAIARTADGKLISSNNLLVEYGPLLPGQTSPFKGYVEYNPAIHSVDLAFKKMLGGTIDFSGTRSQECTGSDGASL